MKNWSLLLTQFRVRLPLLINQSARACGQLKGYALNKGWREGEGRYFGNNLSEKRGDMKKTIRERWPLEKEPGMRCEMVKGPLIKWRRITWMWID